MHGTLILRFVANRTRMTRISLMYADLFQFLSAVIRSGMRHPRSINPYTGMKSDLGSGTVPTNSFSWAGDRDVVVCERGRERALKLAHGFVVIGKRLQFAAPRGRKRVLTVEHEEIG